MKPTISAKNIAQRRYGTRKLGKILLELLEIFFRQLFVFHLGECFLISVTLFFFFFFYSDQFLKPVTLKTTKTGQRFTFSKLAAETL